MPESRRPGPGAGVSARPRHAAARKKTARNKAGREEAAPRPPAAAKPATVPARAAASGERGLWLVKSEPFKYSWQQFAADGKTGWDGVRNHEARNHLASMRLGDLAFFYHSNEGKEIVGVARVVRTAYPDPTADDPRWVAVELAPLAPLTRPVGLAEMKSDPALAQLELLRRSRLSVVPVTPVQWAHILELGQTRI